MDVNADSLRMQLATSADPRLDAWSSEDDDSPHSSDAGSGLCADASSAEEESASEEEEDEAAEEAAAVAAAGVQKEVRAVDGESGVRGVHFQPPTKAAMEAVLAAEAAVEAAAEEEAARRQEQEKAARHAADVALRTAMSAMRLEELRQVQALIEPIPLMTFALSAPMPLLLMNSLSWIDPRPVGTGRAWAASNGRDRDRSTAAARQPAREAAKGSAAAAASEGGRSR